MLSRFSAWKGRSRWNASSLHSCCVVVESRGSDTREKVGRASCSLGCNCPTNAGWANVLLCIIKSPSGALLSIFLWLHIYSLHHGTAYSWAFWPALTALSRTYSLAPTCSNPVPSRPVFNAFTTSYADLRQSLTPTPFIQLPATLNLPWKR